MLRVERHSCVPGCLNMPLLLARLGREYVAYCIVSVSRVI